jgi:hypothetical protein
MLAGEAVVAIWNDVVPEGLAAFHAWHIAEHMPERVGIPGFRRGRRYVSPADACAFFTLYEVDTIEVLAGADYTARLNAPTAATQANILNFRNTIRSLARVERSMGLGVGGALMTLRFEVEEGAGAAPAALLSALMEQPRMIGAHLCRTDMALSGVVTREKEGRTDLMRPPSWFILAEATDLAAFDGAADEALCARAGLRGVSRGLWRLEQLRNKTAFRA